MSSSLDAFMQRTAGAIVPQGQSQEAAQQMVLRLIEQMTAMFYQATQGHAAMNMNLLRQMAAVLQQYPNVSVYNIDNTALTNQVLAITDGRQVNVQAPIQNVMNTLNLPNVTPTAIGNVAQQLAISPESQYTETPQLPPPPSAVRIDETPQLPPPPRPLPETPQLPPPPRPLRDIAEMPGPAIVLPKAPPMPPPETPPETPPIPYGFATTLGPPPSQTSVSVGGDRKSSKQSTRAPLALIVR